MSTSASCRMKPSPTSPASFSASGPYAATHTSSSEPRLHGNCSVAPLYSTGRELPSSRITWIDSRSSRHRHRLAVGDAHRRVAAADAADGAVAVHLVERREDGCRDRPVARRGVRDERADRDALRLGEDRRVDDVRLLPQQVRVEGPHVAEAVRLGELGELHRRAMRAGWSGGRRRSPWSRSLRYSIAGGHVRYWLRPRLRIAAVALGAEVLAAVDDDLAAREHGVDVPVDLEALPRGVVHVHVVGLAARRSTCGRSGRRRRRRRRRRAGSRPCGRTARTCAPGSSR